MGVDPSCEERAEGDNYHLPPALLHRSSTPNVTPTGISVTICHRIRVGNTRCILQSVKDKEKYPEPARPAFRTGDLDSERTRSCVAVGAAACPHPFMTGRQGLSFSAEVRAPERQLLWRVLRRVGYTVHLYLSCLWYSTLASQLSPPSRWRLVRAES